MAKLKNSVDPDTEVCPACGADWQGPPIPLESRQYYGDSTHFSRLIGVEIRGKGDRVDHWKCPDCGAEFPRD